MCANVKDVFTNSTSFSVFVIVLFLAFASVATEITALNQNQGSGPTNDLPNPYAGTKPWGTLPDGRSWGPVNAVTVDRSNNHVWVADRCGGTTCVESKLDPILEFDDSGKLLRSFGADIFAVPHGICLGPDSVWVTDSGPSVGDAPLGLGFQVVRPGGSCTRNKDTMKECCFVDGAAREKRCANFYVEIATEE